MSGTFHTRAQDLTAEDALRTREARLRALVIVAVSGYAQPEDVKKAMAAGFDAHVAKPPDVADLERLLG